MRNLGKINFSNFKRIGLLVVALVIMLATTTACLEAEDDDKSRRDAVAQREQNFDRAEAMWPAPTNLSNFPLRRALVEFTQRQDLINHPWYIYILGMDGSYIGYFIGQTYPINACNFLSSTERSVDTGNSEHIVTAPSYDGIFYGGGGSASACDVYFFFDVQTNAMHTFRATYFFATDAPLNLPGVNQIGSTTQVPNVEDAAVVENTDAGESVGDVPTTTP